MPLTYPLAETARAALESQTSARTLGEARDKAGASVSLVCDWWRPSQSEREALQTEIDAGVTAGFLQIYEDSQGQPVLAVTFWRQGAARPASTPQRAPAEPGAAQAGAQPIAPADTVDDLYFEKSPASRRVKARRRSRLDPNQLDLFSGPDQRGFEAPDPANPDVMLVEEEGSGAAFGLAAPSADEASPAKTRKRKRKTEGD